MSRGRSLAAGSALRAGPGGLPARRSGRAGGGWRRCFEGEACRCGGDLGRGKAANAG